MLLYEIVLRMPNRPPGRIAYPAKVLFGSIGESLSLTGPASQLSTNSCTWEWKCQRGEQCNAAERRSTSWRFLVYGPQSTGTALRTRQLLDLYPPCASQNDSVARYRFDPRGRVRNGLVTR